MIPKEGILSSIGKHIRIQSKALLIDCEVFEVFIKLCRDSSAFFINLPADNINPTNADKNAKLCGDVKSTGMKDKGIHSCNYLSMRNLVFRSQCVKQ